MIIETGEQIQENILFSDTKEEKALLLKQRWLKIDKKVQFVLKQMEKTN